MGLRTNKTAVPEETNVDEVKEVTEAEVEEASQETPQETAVAVKKTAAVAPYSGTSTSIESLLNKWDPEVYGNVFKRIKGEVGSLCTDGYSFGAWVDAQVFSHSKRWFVTPIVNKGEPNFKEASKYCRASYDGKTIPGRDGEEPELIEDYIKSIEDLYPKGCKVSNYHDIFCVLHGSEKNFDKVGAADVFQISVAPTAIKPFNAFTKCMPLAVIRGKLPVTHQHFMRVLADPKQNDNGSYTIMKFDLVPEDIVETYVPVPTPD